MKIFISHSSINKEYGNALVELLRGIGLNENEIIFTSNVAYGIPIGHNIFNWLKSQITEKPFVIYLLSKEYYSSVACLNEMGAAWIIENEHAVIFTPNFDIHSREFQNGALDPRAIGFFINDEERLLSFIQKIEPYFSITKNTIILNQKLKHFLTQINLLSTKYVKETPKIVEKVPIDKKVEELFVSENQPELKINIPTPSVKISINETEIYSKFVTEIINGKVTDAEIMLLNYIIETGRVKLMTGWQESNEIENIKVWEEVNDLKNILSANYGKAISKFGLRKYTEISAVTASGNAKEVKLKSEIESNILELPEEILEILDKITSKNLGRDVKDVTNTWGF